MEVGRKRGISRKMQAKDAPAEALPSTSFPAFSSTAFARCSKHKQRASKHLQRHRRATSEGLWIAEAHARNHKQPTTTAIQTAPLPLLLPSKRPSVAVYFAPLLCRLLLKYTIIIQHLHQLPSIPAKYREHVRQGRRSHSFQPAPCFHPTAGASTECAARIARRTGHRGATE